MRYGFKDVVIDSRTGLNPRKNFVLGSGKNNYITIKDIYNGQINITDKTDKVDDDAIQIIKKRSRIKVGDILFVSIGRIGETAIVTAKDDTWDVNESVFVFTINSEIITPEYFCILFQSDAVQKYLTGNSSGSTFKSIKMNQLEKMVFDLPPLSIQKEITAKLSKAKSICNLRSSELAQLDDLIKARFVEMFGEEAEMGIPLKECCVDVRGGGTPSMKHPEYYGGNVPFIKSGDIRGDLVYSGALWLTEKALTETTAKYVPQGAVLVVNRSAALLREFRAAIAAQPVVINQDIKAFIPKEGFTSEYLLWAIKIQTQYLLTKVTTVLTSHIDLKDLLELRIAPASIERQINFTRFVAQVDKSKFAVQKALDEAQTLYDSLMQKYFG